MNVLTRRLAWLVLPLAATPAALEAQACLGFSGSGFLSGSGAVWRESSEDVRGLGAAAGFDLGPVAATGHYLKFSGADEFDQEFDFEDARASVGLKLPLPVLSVCPLVTVGIGGVLPTNSGDLPYRSETVYGVGVAVGQRFGAPGSGLAIIPSATVSIENYSVDRLYDDIVEGDREVSPVISGGVTVEIGSIRVRPYVRFTTAEDSYLIAGALLGVTF
ncbi:hypothetical protein [Candidatus Palauibacter sp.]|uniref:hypothetical protein n=1 Tax=Candidatus Palauibacter sp. TaxID=3101350 RepID=UPI003D0F3FFD